MWAQAEDSKDAKEIAAILAAENVELVAEEDREKLQELDSLTGQPRATDILLYALPVLPYSLQSGNTWADTTIRTIDILSMRNSGAAIF